MKSGVVCALGALFSSLSIAAGGTATDSHDHGPAKLGKVHFPIECSAEAQSHFDVAMAYFHSFAWAQIGAPLDRVLQADPNCGMAHWARALASLDNPFGWPGNISPKTLTGGQTLLDEARKAGLKTQRERDYVDALEAFFRDHDKLSHRVRAKALEDALQQVAQRYPDDSEASILHALVLSANFDPTDKEYRNQLRAAAILEPIFRSQPDHPGVAHYLIHSYDYPPIASKGLEAARRYGSIAPDAAHAQHMPSHIFTRVGAWQESIEANTVSARTDTARSYYTMHAYDYMVYAHLQLGQDGEARKVLNDAASLPKPPDHFAAAYAYAAIPARIALERGDWQQAASLPLEPPAGAFPWNKYPQAESVNAFARGLGAARAKDTGAAAAQVERLQALREAAGALKLGYWVEQIDIQAEVVRGLAAVSEGRHDEGMQALRGAAKREDASEKHVVTPGPILPAREVLATVLLEDGQAAEALSEFESVLQREPNRLRAIAGAAAAAEQAGEAAKAKSYHQRVVELTDGHDGSRPEVARARQYLARG